jgi:cyclophilin family peptidyl-prolyl cis-trans isomerase
VKKLILLLALCATGWLTLPAEAQSSNTFVRFRFSYGGTIFGDVEVELFNHDKPVTVSNFLHYVRSGGYQNTFIHRAYPGFGGPAIIQGGGYRLVNPYSTKLFTDCGYEEIAPTNSTPAIINESQFVPIHTNGSGTLAMATQDGEPDSARASWFFNLMNNPSFNTNNGGYAVFGRVIRDPKKILNYFRSIQWADGIMYLPYANFYCSGIALFQELPIAKRPGYFCASASLLFAVEITELNSTNRADTSRPVLTLATPTSNQRLSNDTAMITGKASDKGLGLAEVRVYPSPCDDLVAMGTTNWSLSLTGVPPGTNIIEVESVDAAGNRSAIIRRTFFRVLTTPVTLTNTGGGSGSVSGLPIGQTVEIGRDYLLTAKADAGSLFAGWRAEKISYTATNSITNAITENTASIRIRADSNLTFRAMFVTNPFPPLVGTYVGLFYHTNFYLAHGYSGAVKFTLTSQGKFTGSAQFGSKSYPFSGTFHPATGSASIRFKGPGGGNIVMDPVLLNLTNNMETINGVISDNNTWASAINARRVRSGTTANPSPYKGSYTWMAPGDTEPTVKPSGDSFGKFTVSKTGSVTFSGTMADGTPVSGGGPIGTNGIWGLRAALYSGTGSILSWVTVDTNRLNEDLFGTFYWFHPALPKAKFYTNAFTATTSITGSRYVAPLSKTNVVLPQLTNGVVALLDGNLAGPHTNLIVLGLNNVVTNQSTNKLTFTLTKTTGLFTGTVAPTNQTKTVTYKGAILQKQGYGTGFHLDTNKSGRVYFGP